MAGKTASLAEMMGRKSEQAKEQGLGLDDLKELLGEGMPDLKFNAVGRIRLVRALKQRFGAGFRSIPGVSGIMKEFDEESRFNLTVIKMKGLTKGRKRG